MACTNQQIAAMPVFFGCCPPVQRSRTVNMWTASLSVDGYSGRFRIDGAPTCPAGYYKDLTVDFYDNFEMSNIASTAHSHIDPPRNATGTSGSFDFLRGGSVNRVELVFDNGTEAALQNFLDIFPNDPYRKMVMRVSNPFDPTPFWQPLYDTLAATFDEPFDISTPDLATFHHIFHYNRSNAIVDASTSSDYLLPDDFAVCNSDGYFYKRQILSFSEAITPSNFPTRRYAMASFATLLQVWQRAILDITGPWYERQFSELGLTGSDGCTVARATYCPTPPICTEHSANTGEGNRFTITPPITDPNTWGKRGSHDPC